MLEPKEIVVLCVFPGFEIVLRDVRLLLKRESRFNTLSAAVEAVLLHKLKVLYLSQSGNSKNKAALGQIKAFLSTQSLWLLEFSELTHRHPAFRARNSGFCLC